MWLPRKYHLHLLQLGSGCPIITRGPAKCKVHSKWRQVICNSLIARYLERFLQILLDEPWRVVGKSCVLTWLVPLGPLPISDPGWVWPRHSIALTMNVSLLFCVNMVIFSWLSSQSPPQPSLNFNFFQGCADPVSNWVCCPRNWRSSLEEKNYLSRLWEIEEQQEEGKERRKEPIYLNRAWGMVHIDARGGWVAAEAHYREAHQRPQGEGGGQASCSTELWTGLLCRIGSTLTLPRVHWGWSTNSHKKKCRPPWDKSRCLISFHGTYFNAALQTQDPKGCWGPCPRSGHLLLVMREGGLTLGADLSGGWGKETKSVFSTWQETASWFSASWSTLQIMEWPTWWSSEGPGVLDSVLPGHMLYRFLCLFFLSRPHALPQPSLL